MRTPVRRTRQLGVFGFLAFQLAVGGNVLAALIHPIFLGMLAYAIVTGQPWFGVNGIPEEVTWAFVAALCAGYLVTGILGLRGLARRSLLSSSWWLLAVPLHWLMLSLAAWRAMFQLIRDPFGWEKTAHGLAKTSRLDEIGAPTASDDAIGGSVNGRAVQRRRGVT